MTNVAIVAFGGALGAAARYLFVVQAGRWFGIGFPWGTLGVNLIGSLAIGLLVGAGAHAFQVGQSLRLFLAVGVLGGFTTFSSFSLDAVTLLERGDWLAGTAYVAGSVLAGLAAFVAGVSIWRFAG